MWYPPAFSVFLFVTNFLRNLPLNCRFSNIPSPCTQGSQFTITAGLKTCPAGTDKFDPPSKFNQSLWSVSPWFAPWKLSENNIDKGGPQIFNSTGRISYEMDQWSWLYDHQIFILIPRASRRHHFKPALTSTSPTNSPSSRVLQMFLTFLFK